MKYELKIFRFWNTPHPTFRCAQGHPLPQGERDSYRLSSFPLASNKERCFGQRITSPLVGEVAQRAGEGYFNILQNQKICSRLLYLLPVSWLLISAETQAALVRPLDDFKVIEVPISQSGLTRITVKGDRISNVFGVAGEYVMEPDETQGQIFIRPLEPALNPISLTVTTEGGHTQDLRLVPKNQSPEALVLKVEQASGGEKSQEAPTGQITRGEIEDLLYACAEGRIPVGYLNVPLEIPNPHELPHLIREVKNNKLRGLTFEVTNLATIPWILAESGFADSLDIEVIAVLMPKKLLTPGERMQVYVAARSI